MPASDEKPAVRRSPRVIAAVVGALALGAVVIADRVRVRMPVTDPAPAVIVAAPAQRDLPLRWRPTVLVAPLTLVSAFHVEEASITALAVAPAGDRVVSGGADGQVILSDLATGARIRPLAGHAARVGGVAWSPDGKLVASAGALTVIVSDAATGERRLTLDLGASPATSVDFSPDGARLAAGSFGGAVRVWTVATFALAQSFAHEGRVLSVRFSADGRSLATAGDSHVRVWDVRGDGVVALPGSERGVPSVAWLPDGRLAVSDDRSFRVWTPRSGGEVHARASDLGGEVATVAAGPALATAGRDGVVRLYDEASWKRVATREIDPKGVLALAWARDGALVVGDASGRVSVLRHELATRVAEVPEAPKGVERAAVTPGERAYARAMTLVDAYDGQPASLDAPEQWLRAALPPAPAKGDAIVLVGLARIACERAAGSGDAPPQPSLAVAQPLLEQALALDPNLPDAHAEQGWLAYLAKDNERALREATAAAGLAPRSRAELLLATLGTGDEAERHARTALALASESERARVYLALERIYQARGDYVAAERCFERCLSLGPHSGLILARYATFLVDREQYDRAIATAEAAVAASDVALTREALARALTEKGADALWSGAGPAAATPLFERALAAYPRYAHAHYGLAACLRKRALERTDRRLLARSTEELTRAVSLDHDPLAKEALKENERLLPP